jgi:hypothetical protein
MGLCCGEAAWPWTWPKPPQRKGPAASPMCSHEVEITEGKRVFLIYKGWLMGAMVTQVVMPGAVFVGRVLAFEGNELTHGELKYDDLVRFRKADVR